MRSLLLTLLQLMCLRGDAQGQEMCFLELRVQRYTVWKASTMETLRINCTVMHCGTTPEVVWCKVDDSNNCIPVEETDHINISWEDKEGEPNSGLSFLRFVNTSLNDTGLYRCGIKENTTTSITSVSHSINVSITAAQDNKNVILPTLTTVPLPDTTEQNPLHWPSYIYISAGILALVITVTVTSCFIIRKHKGSRPSPAAKETQDKTRMNSQRLNKDEAPNMNPQPPRPDLPSRTRSIRAHPAQPHARSSIIYDNTPSRNSSRTKRGATKEAPPTSSNSGGIYDNDREESEAPLVYAALRHHATREMSGPTRSAVVTEEQTEYAAIRVL